MNKKVLSLAITMAMALPTVSHALGLGDIQSNSHLNEPFRGTIQVLSATPAEARSLRVRLASPEVFNRVGIDRPAFLNSIRFTPSVQRGKPVILVSSTQPIHEPFVNFLLEVSWPKGQLLKEYTALLDPPVLMQPGRAIASNKVGVRAEPGRINRPVAQRQQQARQQQQRRVVRAPAPTARRAPPRRLTELQRAAQALGVTTTARARPTGRTKTYRVKRGDYLYKVAKKLGYRGVRTEQMMMALYEANPKAFHASNVNNLKAGAVMQRPSAQQAKGISYRSARSQLASHTASWKSSRSQLASQSRSNSATAKSSLNDSSTSRGNANTPDHKLVVSGNDGAVVNDINISGNASAAKLKKQLVLASESLTARSNENAELKSRVAELESLLRKKNRLITLKSEQLTELQARMGGESITPENPQTNVIENEIDTPIESEILGSEGTDIQQQVANQNANEQGEIIRTVEPEFEEPAVEPEVQQPTASVSSAEDSEAKDKGILGLLDNPMVTGIGGGSLLALLGGLWFMRRRKNQDHDDVDGDYSDFDLDQELAQTTSLEQDNTAAEDDFSTTNFAAEENMFADPEVKATDTVDTSSKSENEEEPESKEENILQEADVYLVYGLHDQAEAELRKAIEEEPDNLAYRAKLIENFKAAGDKEGFEKEVKIFKEMDGANKEKKLWEDITGWAKSLLPDSNLFSGAGKAAAAGAVTAAAAGLAVTAGKASPEEVVQFDTDLDKAFEADDLEGLDLNAVLDDDTSKQGSVSESLIEDDIFDAKTETVDFDNSFDVKLDTELDGSTNTLDIDDTLNDLSSSATETIEFTAADNIADGNIDEALDGFDLDLDMTGSDTANIDGAKVGDVLDATSLNLDIDGEDFDKIMPEDHAYKKVTESAKLAGIETAAKESEDNLLADFDDNLSFLDLEDNGDVIEETQIGTKLDLAKAYIDMGDIDGARSTLEEVIMEGNDEQKKEAEELLHQTG